MDSVRKNEDPGQSSNDESTNMDQLASRYAELLLLFRRRNVTDQQWLVNLCLTRAANLLAEERRQVQASDNQRGESTAGSPAEGPSTQVGRSVTNTQFANDVIRKLLIASYLPRIIQARRRSHAAQIHGGARQNNERHSPSNEQEVTSSNVPMTPESEKMSPEDQPAQSRRGMWVSQQQTQKPQTRQQVTQQQVTQQQVTQQQVTQQQQEQKQPQEQNGSPETSGYSPMQLGDSLELMNISPVESGSQVQKHDSLNTVQLATDQHVNNTIGKDGVLDESNNLQQSCGVPKHYATFSSAYHAESSQSGLLQCSAKVLHPTQSLNVHPVVGKHDGNKCQETSKQSSNNEKISRNGMGVRPSGARPSRTVSIAPTDTNARVDDGTPTRKLTNDDLPIRNLTGTLNEEHSPGRQSTRAVGGETTDDELSGTPDAGKGLTKLSGKHPINDDMSNPDSVVKQPRL